jgi:hypothetical protein
MTTMPRKVSTYYRIKVAINTTWPGYVRMQYIVDDGAVVYMNGREVGRGNMPAGVVTAVTTASTKVDTPSWLSPLRLNVNTSQGVVNGINTVAVELHQESQTSTDAAFDMVIDFIRDLPSPTPSPSASASLTAIPKGSEQIKLTDLWKINDFGLDPGSEWAKETYDDSQWRSGRTIAGE